MLELAKDVLDSSDGDIERRWPWLLRTNFLLTGRFKA